MIDGGVEHLLVQAGFGIALAELAEENLPGLGDQLRVGRDAPLGMRGQLLAVELPEIGRQGLPQAGGDARTQRFGVIEGFSEEFGVGFFRMRQHQVGLELAVGDPGLAGALGTVRRKLDQRHELALQVSRSRIAHQAVVGVDIARPQGVEQGLVLVQAETLVPGRTVFGAVVQPTEFAGQLVQGLELFVALSGVLQRSQRGLHVADQGPVAGVGQQQAGGPHQRQAHGQGVTDTRGAPADPADKGFVPQNTFPGRVDGPEMILGNALHRQTEPQATQGHTTGELTE